MRLLPRSTPIEPLATATAANDAIQVGDNGAKEPVKSQNFFGVNSRSKSNKIKKGGQRESFAHVPSAEQKSLGNMLRTQEQLLDSIPSARNGERNMPWRKIQQQTPMQNRSTQTLVRNPSSTSVATAPNYPPRNDSFNAVQPRQFYMNQQPSLESMQASREYYDPAKQPLHVSQQTSASAARDMGLRRGFPMIHATSSDPTLVPRPLKSALKNQKTEAGRKPSNGSPKRPRKLDLASLFPQPKTSRQNLLSPAKFAQSSTALTDVSEFFPQETGNLYRKPALRSGYDTYTSAREPSVDSQSTATTGRAKIFEPDIFDSKKTNVRRPPKGIQNWFDGFDISSDEEEKEPIPPAELAANEALPSTFRLHGQRSRQPTPIIHKTPADPLRERVMAREQAKQNIRHQVKDSDASTVPETVSSAALLDARRDGGSRLAHSRLGSQSVLSLSASESEDETANYSRIRDSVSSSVVIGNASSLGMQRPTIPPRKLHNYNTLSPQQSMIRKSTSTGRSSGSIPIRLMENTPLPPMPEHGIKSGSSEPMEATQRKLNGQRDSESQPSRSRRTTRSFPEREDNESAAGETTSSALTDSSRLMAVSEEEMILLELMRQKRAAMQKDSFSEGYRLALKEEQQHLAKRRESAHLTALQLLKKKEEITAAVSEKKMQDRGSRGESLLSEKRDLRRKMSAIRKEDVDKALKMERFLGIESPDANEFPDPPVPRLNVDIPSQSRFEETLLPQTVYSPLPKFTDERGKMDISPSSTLPPEDEDIEEHHDRIRAFLASSGASDSASAVLFPTPPSHKKTNDFQVKRMSMLAPSPVLEEEPIVPNIPERSPNRLDPRRPRKHTRETADPAPGMLPAPNYLDFDLDLLTPSLDIAPSELPSASGRSGSGRTGSPSVSTSRASPLTPTFTTLGPSSDKATIETAGSDNTSYLCYRGQAGTPDTELSLGAATPASGLRSGKRAPPPSLDTIRGKEAERIASMGSIGSAPEVLAAWADLGGGNDAFASKRTRGR